MSNETHTSRSLRYTLLVKFLAAVFIGFIVEALLLPIQGWEPVRELKYLGEDVVFSALSERNPRVPPTAYGVVFVNIDDASLRNWQKSPGDDIRPEITKLLTELRQSKANVIVVDIDFKLPRGAIPNPLQSIMEERGQPVVAVADIQPADPSLPMSMARLGPNYGSLAQDRPEGLTLATPDLVLVNNKVRERVTVQCLHTGTREVALPGIAEAVRQVLSETNDDRKHKAESAPDETAHNCNKVSKDKTPIIFVQPYTPLHSNPYQGYLTEVSASNATSSFAELENKIVVVGQTHIGATDVYPTPIGWMPGVFVHLNSIMSDQILEGVKEASFLQELKLLLIIVISVSTVYLLYWAIHEKWIKNQPLQTSAKGFGIFVIDLVLFAFVTWLAIFVLIKIVEWQGADFLQRGVIVGTLVPALAVILEAAFELGRPTMFWLEKLAEVVVRPFERVARLLLEKKNRGPCGAAVLGAMLLAASGALATEQPIARLYPEQGSQFADFTVERRGTDGRAKIGAPDASGTLFVGDVVRAIRQGAAATVVSISTRAFVARVIYNNPIKIVDQSTSPPAPILTTPGASEARARAGTGTVSETVKPAEVRQPEPWELPPPQQCRPGSVGSFWECP